MPGFNNNKTMQILRDPTRYGNNIVQLLPKRKGDDRDGWAPKLIVAHIQAGMNDLFAEFNNRVSNLADCTVVSLRSGVQKRLLEDTTCPWTNGLLASPNKANPMISYIVDNKIYPNDLCLTVEHQGMGGDDFTEEQINADAWLFAYWCQKYNIPADANHIIGHNSFDNQTRANCPGRKYPFSRIISMVEQILNLASYDGLPDYRVEGSVKNLPEQHPTGPTQVAQGYVIRNGHTIGNDFYRYWKENGGLIGLGEPLTNEYDEKQPDGSIMVVQVFERQLLEYHPKNAVGYQTLGRRLGAAYLAAHPEYSSK